MEKGRKGRSDCAFIVGEIIMSNVYLSYTRVRVQRPLTRGVWIRDGECACALVCECGS